MKISELCQVPGTRGGSCGACCGMYNWVGYSRQLVREVLEIQTDAYHHSDRTESDLVKLKREISKRRPKVLYPVIYNCEFLGFIDPERTRVGCLAHPILNQGRNLRGISAHGRETCDESKCTAYFYLKDSEALALAQAISDWYLYGLCLTDLDFIKEFFCQVQGRIFQELKPEHLRSNVRLLEIFQSYLQLKESWAYRRDPYRFGKYYFRNSTYFIYQINYPALGSSVSKYDRIFNSLSSEFRDRSELREAEEVLEGIFQDFAENF